MKVGSNELRLGQPLVMTIINVTPDSFFAGSRTLQRDEIARRVDEAVEHGASMLDVGGYSSRPGAEDVLPHDELDRVCRALEVIRKRHPDVVVSIDTFRASVADGAMERFGECVINDISSGTLDDAMIDVASRRGVPYIAMHMKADPATMQNSEHTVYDNITEEVCAFFAAKLAEFKRRGVRNVILDPGFGFAKTTWQNYELLEGMDSLQRFGRPVLAGVSRKSMIYKVLETTPAEALTGTIALNWECLNKGASILRVHDTREAAEVVKLFNYYKG